MAAGRGVLAFCCLRRVVPGERTRRSRSLALSPAPVGVMPDERAWRSAWDAPRSSVGPNGDDFAPTTAVVDIVLSSLYLLYASRVRSKPSRSPSGCRFCTSSRSRVETAPKVRPYAPAAPRKPHPEPTRPRPYLEPRPIGPGRAKPGRYPRCEAGRGDRRGGGAAVRSLAATCGCEASRNAAVGPGHQMLPRRRDEPVYSRPCPPTTAPRVSRRPDMLTASPLSAPALLATPRRCSGWRP